MATPPPGPPTSSTPTSTRSSADPTIAAAIDTGLCVLGRHVEDGRVVVDLASPEYLAWRREAGGLHALFGGTTRSGKTDQTALIEQMRRLTS
ncbi:hypothetical protein [Streptomyces zaomyceticus]|uniref:hypothetical protein n=1 Tax=Streptomyces zaomyceticus TaxID=68286 RepID=UPI003790FF13